MLVDEQQAIELALAQPGDALPDKGMILAARRSMGCTIVMAAWGITLHQHEWPFTAKDEIKQKSPPPAGFTFVLYNEFVAGVDARDRDRAGRGQLFFGTGGEG